VPVLAAALDEEESLIRGHAAWALGRIVTRDAVEEDRWVREEISFALTGRDPPRRNVLHGQAVLNMPNRSRRPSVGDFDPTTE
jgi:hypothetical protein